MAKTATKSKSATRLVPLGDRQPRRVEFLWYQARSTPDLPGSSIVAIPRFGPGGAPALVTIFADPSLAISTNDPNYERIATAAAEVERAERTGPTIIKSLMNGDRSEPGDRERAIDDLVDLELLARRFARRAALTPTATHSELDRLKAVATTIEEACENAGLDEIVHEAENRVSLSRGLEDSATTSATTPGGRVRISTIGSPTDFRAKNPDSAGSCKFSLHQPIAATVKNQAERWTILGVILVVTLVCGRWVARPRLPLSRSVRLLAALLLVVGVTWEPIGFSVLFGLLVMGRRAS